MCFIAKPKLVFLKGNNETVDVCYRLIIMTWGGYGGAAGIMVLVVV